MPVVNTSAEFYVPPTLQSDFDHFLSANVPNMVANFTKIPDWYDQTKNAAIRGEIYPETSKSRYGNSDNMLNFRASVSSGLKKGDMLKDASNTVYLCDWEVLPEHNNRATRALRCNAKLTFRRYAHETTDADGYLTSAGGMTTVAGEIPCNCYRYDGRPEYDFGAGYPGAVNNAITIVYVQYNSYTKEIAIDDEFVWGSGTMKVIDINETGMNADGTSGVITLQCMMKSGGAV